MDKTSAIDYFGSTGALAKACDVGSSAVSQWPEQLPFKVQCLIQVLTKGKLKAERPQDQKQVAK
jgi:hypothetical protein